MLSPVAAQLKLTGIPPAERLLPPEVHMAVTRPESVPRRTNVASVRTNDPYDIYVGRRHPRHTEHPLKLGNPFRPKDPHPVTGKPMTVGETLPLYRDMMKQRIRTEEGLFEELADMSGKTIACWCSPLGQPAPCHAHELQKLIDLARQVLDDLGPRANWEGIGLADIFPLGTDKRPAPVRPIEDALPGEVVTAAEDDELAQMAAAQGGEPVTSAPETPPPPAPTEGRPYRTYQGDIWKYEGADAIVITTNGVVKRKVQGEAFGRAVMGRGIALKAKNTIPNIDLVLGEHLTRNGNVVGIIGETAEGVPIVSLPVKPAGTAKDPGWAMNADPDLINESIGQLTQLTEQMGWQNVIMPPPGTGNGKLNFVDVEHALDQLDQRFIVADFRPIPERGAAAAQVARPATTGETPVPSETVGPIEPVGLDEVPETIGAEEEAAFAAMGEAPPEVPRGEFGEATDMRTRMAEAEERRQAFIRGEEPPVAGGAAPPSEPPIPPRGAVTGGEPEYDPNWEVELEHHRRERDRILAWQQDNPKPTQTPVSVQEEGEWKRLIDEGATTTDTHSRVSQFLNQISPEGDPTRNREALYRQLVRDTQAEWGGRRSASIEDLAAEMGQSPERVAKSLEWLDQMGFTTRTDDGKVSLTPMTNEQVDEYFDWVTEVSNMGESVRPVSDDPEIVAFANEHRRRVYTDKTNDSLQQIVAEELGDDIGELTGVILTDTPIKQARVRRGMDILNRLDDIVERAMDDSRATLNKAGVLPYGKRIERRGSSAIGMEGPLDRRFTPRKVTIEDTVLDEIGFDPDAYRAMVYQRVNAWVNQMTDDLAAHEMVTDMAGALVRQMGEEVTDEAVSFIAQELLDARSNTHNIGPLGPGATQWERAILKGDHSPRQAKHLKSELVRSNQNNGLHIGRRPWISKGDGNTQLDELERRGFFQWLADEKDSAAIIKMLGGLPDEDIRTILMTEDARVARKVIEGQWMKGFKEMPELRRNPAQLISGRRPRPTVKPRLDATELDELTTLQKRPRKELTPEAEARLSELADRHFARDRRGGSAALDTPAEGPNDLPGRKVQRDESWFAIARRRWMAEGGGSMLVLDRDNMQKSVQTAREWLDNIGASPAEKVELLRAMTMADDDLHAWDPIKETYMKIFYNALVKNERYSPELAQAVVDKWQWFDGQKQAYIADATGREFASRHGGLIKKWGGKDPEESAIRILSPVFEADFQRRHVVLPDIQSTRRATSAFRRVRNKWKPMTNVDKVLAASASEVALNKLNSLWKDAALIRFGWPIRVLTDELARMAAVGLGEFMGPHQLFSYAMGKGDMTLLGSTWRDAVEAFGGVGTGWYADRVTGAPLVGSKWDFDKADWTMAGHGDNRYWPALLNRIGAAHHSPLAQMVASRKVEGTLEYLTKTTSGRRHLAKIQKEAVAGTLLGQLDDPEVLLRTLQMQEASMAHLAGGKIMYRDFDHNAKTWGDWKYNSGKPVEGNDAALAAKRVAEDDGVEFLVIDPGHDQVWDLIRNGSNGRVPESSVYAAIHGAETGTARTMYYPIPDGDDTGIGNLGYEVSRITGDWEAAVKAAGRKGQVAILPENEAQRMISFGAKNNEDLVDIPRRAKDPETLGPMKVSTRSVNEYRSNPARAETMLDTTIPEASIFFDVKMVDEPTMNAQAEALKNLYGEVPHMEWSDELGKEIERMASTAPAEIPVPKTSSHKSPQDDKSVRELLYHVLTAPSDLVSRTTMGKLTYWEEVARVYIHVPEGLQGTLRGKARQAGMENVLDKFVNRHLRDAGYRTPPKPTLHDIDIVDIEELALHESAKKVRDLLYDQTKISNISDAGRLIAPFAEAFWEVITRWTKLMNPAQNPRALRNWRRVEQAVMGMHQAGWFQEDQYGNEVFRMPGMLNMVNNVALGGAIDPTQLTMFDPTSPGGFQPGMGILPQTAASFITPALDTMPKMRDFINWAAFGDYGPPENTLVGRLMQVAPTPYRRLGTMLFDEQRRADLGDDMMGVMQALLLTGDPKYDPRTTIGMKNLQDKAQSMGTLIGWTKVIDAFLLPGQPRPETSLKISQDYADGTIGEEWLDVDFFRNEWFDALRMFGDQQAAYSYFVERYQMDPLSITSESWTLKDYPVTRTAYDWMQTHPEVQDLAGLATMAFIPPDPNGDFFSIAWDQAKAENAIQAMRPEQLPERVLLARGFHQMNNMRAIHEGYRQEAEDVLGYGTEAYYARLRELEVVKAAEVKRIQGEYFAGESNPSVTGEPQGTTYMKELDQLREIGSEAHGRYQPLYDLNPQFVDFLTLMDQMIVQAEGRAGTLNPGGSTTWWMTSEYGTDAEGNTRDANEIKEWFIGGMNDLYLQMTDPRAREAAEHVFSNVVTPMLSGIDRDEYWVRPVSRWPNINPAQLQVQLGRTQVFGEGVPMEEAS